MTHTVIFSKFVSKQLRKCPVAIQSKVSAWVLAVETSGLDATRQRPSFHDEPLQGQRAGQRSVRLNRQWRLIYEEKTGKLLEIQEVTPHDYRTR
jgi:proteic killer suppression protein